MFIDIFISVFLLLLLLFFSGFFSSSEISLFSLTSSKIRAYQASDNPKKNLVAKLLNKPHELLITIFLFNTLVNILLQNVSSHLFGDASGWTFQVGVPLILTLVFGEIIPKFFALQNNKQLAKKVAPSIDYIQNHSQLLRNFISNFTNNLSRVLFFFLKKDPNISKLELQHALQTSVKNGVLSLEETTLINGYLNLRKSTIKRLMRPREDIICHNINDTLPKLSQLFTKQECSQIPIYEKNLDNIVGICTGSRFFLHQHKLQNNTSLKRILNKPLFVPESTPARTLLKRFEESQTVMALVVDEYGIVTGLITLEDLLEEVVGEITDRRDMKKLYTEAGKNVIIASGKLELSEFETIFNSALSSSHNMVTIGGWLIEKMGHIPKAGEHFETNLFLFHILAADPNRIRRIYIRHLI